MIKFLKFFFREPLVLFLLLGGIVYLIYIALQPITTPTQNFTKTITLSSYEIAALKKSHKNDFKEALKENYFNKALLEEAYALELYKEDPEISKLLEKKMKMILLESKKVQEPSEEELKKYYDEHKKEYVDVDFYSFRIKNAEKRVHQSKEKILKEYGRYFFIKLSGLQLNKWSKELATKKGRISVLVYEKEGTQIESFDVAEDRVYRDFKADRLAMQKEEDYEALAKKYHFTVQ